MEIEDKKKFFKVLNLVIALTETFYCVYYIYSGKILSSLSNGMFALIFLLLFFNKENSNKKLMWSLLLMGIGFWLIQFLSNFWDKY